MPHCHPILTHARPLSEMGIPRVRKGNTDVPTHTASAEGSPPSSRRLPHKAFLSGLWWKSTKVSCGRKRARMTNTSRNGIGASESLAISVSHCAHSLSFSLPTRKFFRRRACASSMEAICCPATQRWSSWRRSLSARWRLDTGRLTAPSQSSLVMVVSNRIHEAGRIGAAILSRLGMTLGCVSFRSARLTFPSGS